MRRLKSYRLRALVLAAFSLLVLSAGLQGLFLVLSTVQSTQLSTTLEQQAVVPAVKIAILTQNLDEERELLFSDLAGMKPAERRAVQDEIRTLDTNIIRTAGRTFSSAARLNAWSDAWSAFSRSRELYLTHRLWLGSGAQTEQHKALVVDRLDALVDLLQGEAGTRLNSGTKTYAHGLDTDWTIIRLGILSALFTMLLGAVLAALIVVRLARGLGNLATTAEQIAEGEVGVRARALGHDEIGRVARTFNQMLDQLTSAEKRAQSDALTGLLNHRAFHERLHEEIERARRSGTNLSVLMIDVNDFKLFNDTYGHQTGDDVLRGLAGLLARECRPSDRAARYGGDEFAVIAPDADLSGAQSLAQRIIRRCTTSSVRVSNNSNALPLKLSIGIASLEEEGDTATALLDLADRRMYEAKRSGGGVWQDNQQVWMPRLRADSPFSSLQGLVAAIDSKDRYTRKHSEWVARFADLLARQINMDREQRERLTAAALIHDVGKIGVPEHILRKPGTLTEDEYTIMKQHVVMSELLVTQMAPDSDMLDAVRYHHERWDGNGYPYGIAGDEAPLVARIMIIADAASAMLLDRPYRKGLSIEAIVGEILRNRGSQFDPRLADLFVEAVMSSSWSDEGWESSASA